jgi:hypothetical protein
MKTLLTLLLLCSAAVYAERPSDADRIPPVSQLSNITMGAGPWQLEILPNGSASVVYGAGPDGFSAPAGTFDFHQIYSSLARVVQSSGNIREFLPSRFINALLRPPTRNIPNDLI